MVNLCLMVNLWVIYGYSMVSDSYPLVMTNNLPWEINIEIDGLPNLKMG